MEKINDLIKKIAEEEMNLIVENGYALQGNNGPYYCNETPIRNSAHWIGIYKYLLSKYDNKKYKDIICILGDFICSKEYFSKSGAIKCMNDNNKMDYLNGSIGQAWAIEGLINAYKVTENEKYYSKAVQIFNSQKYDFQKHLWNRIELDGTNLGFDIVFNHELWLAASGFMIVNAKMNDKINMEINDFMKNVNELFDIYDDGLFKHYVIGMERKENKTLKRTVRDLMKFLSFIEPKFDKLSFEKGYHLFDLYGFAIIYQYNKNFNVFTSKKFKKALVYGLNIDKLNKEYNIKYFCKKNKIHLHKYNKYSYSYNSPAFEYPFIDYILNEGKNIEKYNTIINIQINMTYNDDEKIFNKNTDDGRTLTARLYELTRYLELRG